MRPCCHVLFCTLTCLSMRVCYCRSFERPGISCKIFCFFQCPLLRVYHMDMALLCSRLGIRKRVMVVIFLSALSDSVKKFLVIGYPENSTISWFPRYFCGLLGHKLSLHPFTHIFLWVSTHKREHCWAATKK
ncbi:unnamed protein product [Discosporangium mesarthrocarpum]